MDNKKRILMYENGSGFSFYSSHLCKALVGLYDCSIDYITTPENHYFDDIPNAKAIPILKKYSKRQKKSLLWVIDRILTSIFNCRVRNKYCKKNKHDIISIQFTTSIIDQYYLKKLHKYCSRIVLTAHDVIPPIKSFYWSKKSLKRVYETVDAIIVHSEGNKETLLKEFNISPNKVEVINHGIDVEFNLLNQECCRNKIGLSTDKIVVLFYGLIRDQKGLGILIQSLKNIPDIQLFIAGAMPHGETFDSYEELITSNCVDTVEHIAFVPEDMTDVVFNSCDFVCLPYKYFYSQSGVFMQAIKYRKPVVVSDVSSFREFLDKYNIGFICKPNDVDDLNYAIKRMIDILKNDPHYFKKQLEKAAVENSWIIAAKKHMGVFVHDVKK